MKKCNGCGNELPENAKFCPNCGSAYTEAGETAVDANVNAEKSICEQCGLELPTGAKFCTVCGGKATTGVSMLKPTSPVMPAVASSSGMMQSVSIEEPAPVVAPTPVAAPAPTPVVPVVPSIAETAEDAFVPEVGAIAETGSVTEMDIQATPSVYSTMTASAVEPTPSVSSTMGVQTAAPVATAAPVQPIQPTPVQPVQSVQPVQPVQPVANNVISNTLPSTGTVNTLPNTGVANTLPSNSLPNTDATSAVDYSKMQPVQKKKMKVGGKIAIAVGSVVGAAAIAAGVFFVTNKATFLSTILGKEKYAVMVESESIQQTASAIDTDAIVKSIETLSGAYSAMYSLAGDTAGSSYDMSVIGGADGSTVMLYNGSTASSSAMGMMDSSTAYSGMDFGAYIGYLNKLYVDTYGANGVKMDMSVDVEVRDGLKSMIGGEDVPVDDIVALLNGMEISYDVTAGATALDVTMGAKADTLEVDCRVIMTEDNKMYLALPFVSEKAFCVELPESENAAEIPEETVTLKLDKKELDRIVTEVVETYLLKYKESAIEMEEGSVKIAGETIEGKAITAEFADDKLSDLFESMFSVIAEDEYLCDTIVSYANELGAEITAEDYKTDIMDTVSFEATEDDKLIITTIIDKNGNPLAKTYTAIAALDEAVIGYAVSDTRSICEVIYNNESGEEKKEVTFTFVDTKKDETSGDIKVSVTDGEEEMSYNIVYADAGVKEFCGQDTVVGTYTMTFEMPESFEEQLGEEGFAAINGLSLEVSQSVDGNAATSAIAVDVEDYGRVGFTMNMSVQDNGEPALPTDVIDITSAMEGGEPDQQTIDALKAYMDDFGKYYNEKLVPYIEKFGGEAPEFTNPFDIPAEPDTPDIDEALTVEELKEYIEDDYLSLSEDYQQIPADNTELLAKVSGLAQEYNALYIQVTGEEELSQETLVALTETYWDLFYRMLDIEDEIYNEYEESFQALSPDVEIDSITKMQYTEVALVISECNLAFDMYASLYADEIASNATIKALYDAADYARIDLESDWQYFADQLNRGSININLLTTARNSLKEYLTAIRALEAELAQLG